jgi:hypothetical protein
VTLKIFLVSDEDDKCEPYHVLLYRGYWLDTYYWLPTYYAVVVDHLHLFKVHYNSYRVRYPFYFFLNYAKVFLNLLLLTC